MKKILALLSAVSILSALPLSSSNAYFTDEDDNFIYDEFPDSSHEKTDGDWLFRTRYYSVLTKVNNTDEWVKQELQRWMVLNPDTAQKEMEGYLTRYGFKIYAQGQAGLAYDYLGDEQTDYVEYPDYFVDVSNNKHYPSKTLYKFKNSEKLPYLIFNNVNMVYPYTDLKCKGIKFMSDNITIDENAFSDNQTIEYIQVPSDCEFKAKCFAGSNIQSVEFRDSLPNSRLILKTNAFNNCKKLRHFEFPETDDGLKLSYHVFEGSGLEDITIPSCVETLPSWSFKNCKSLKTAVINGDIEVEERTFEGCDALQEITFNGHPSLNTDALTGCSAENINIDISQGINFRGLDGCYGLMKLNGEDMLNEDGSLKAEKEDFIKNNFRECENVGFINKYIDYRVKNIISEIITDNMTDMEKLKAVHDKVCSMVFYDSDPDARKNHVDSSVFLGESSVCEGYAKAMNLLLHEAGIRSCFVNTLDHAWVIVELDGHYFHVDATWDDGDVVEYDWFLKTDSEIKDDPLHSGWNLICPSPLHAFQCEELPECKEKMGDVNSDGTVDGRDASAVLSSYAKASAGKEPQTDAVLSDMNFDGKTDARDAAKILSVYSETLADAE